MLFNDGNQWHFVTDPDAYPHPMYEMRAASARNGVPYVDPQFHRQRELLQPRVGGFLIYQFPYQNAGSPESQADFFCRAVGTLRPNEMVMLDTEAGSGLVDPADFMRRWCRIVESRLQTLAWIYVPKALAGQLTRAVTGNRIVKAPRYSGNAGRGTPPDWPHDVWQYTDRGPFPGSAHGPGDVNTTEWSLPELLKRSGRPGGSEPVGRPVLRLGDSGPAVRELQTLLNAANIPDPKPPAPPHDRTSPESARLLSWVTGEKAPRPTGPGWAVGGTDIGVAWESTRGDVLLAFGDTFNPRQPQGGGGGGDWRSNVLGRSNDRDPAVDGMALTFVTDRPGHAKEVLHSLKNQVEITVIPTGGVAVTERDAHRDYMSFMSVRHWGEPGRWVTNHGGLAYSRDGGVHWLVGPVWPNSGNVAPWFQMTALVRHDGYLYLFGTPHGRAGNAHLARVPDSGDTPLDIGTYEVLTGGRWTPWLRPAAAPDVLFGDRVSELSVAWHGASKQWLAAYFQEPDAIVVRTSPALEGPWSEPHVVTTAREYPGMYGAFFHPWTMNDAHPCFLMSMWDPYNVALMQLTMEAP